MENNKKIDIYILFNKIYTTRCFLLPPYLKPLKMSHIITQLLNRETPQYNKHNMLTLRKHIDSTRQLVDILMITYTNLSKPDLDFLIFNINMDKEYFAKFYKIHIGANIEMPYKYFETINIMAYELWLSLETCQTTRIYITTILEFLKKDLNKDPIILDDFNELYSKMSSKSSTPFSKQIKK